MANNFMIIPAQTFIYVSCIIKYGKFLVRVLGKYYVGSTVLKTPACCY